MSCGAKYVRPIGNLVKLIERKIVFFWILKIKGKAFINTVLILIYRYKRNIIILALLRLVHYNSFIPVRNFPSCMKY